MSDDSKACVILIAFFIFLTIIMFSGHDVFAMFIVSVLAGAYFIWAIWDTMKIKKDEQRRKEKQRQKIHSDFVRNMTRLEVENDGTRKNL